MWWYYLIYIIIILNVKLVRPQEEEAQSELIVNFIYGLGIPWDVQGGFMTTGYVLKAKYAIPVKLSDWKSSFAFDGRKSDSMNKPVIVKSRISKLRSANDYNQIKELRKRKKPHSNLDKYRWATYKAFETYANRLGFVGRPCVLRSICEANQIPFDWNSGLLGELMHILLSPSTSTDPLTKHSDNEFFHAEYLGKSGAPCDRIFKECSKSLLGEFSGIYFREVKDLL